jgi:hypothetical protein
MSITFTKLFSSITESTVWCEPSDIRIVWITMLAMADKKGRVWASIPGLANRARVTVEDTRIAITTFLSPDPDSRSHEEEGRRIREIDGGWQLINHAKYLAKRDEEDRKEYKREWIKERRQNCRQKTSTVDRGRPQYPHADADADALKEKKEPPSPPKGDDGFNEFWKAYPKKKSKGDAEKAWKALKPTKDLLQTILASVERQKVCADWMKEGGQYIPHPGRWLRAKGWEDEETVAPPPDPDSNLTPTFTDEEAADACIHGWFRSRAFRVKHGDPPDVECGRCRADLFPAGDA